jgi:hypothetical protein
MPKMDAVVEESSNLEQSAFSQDYQKEISDKFDFESVQEDNLLINTASIFEDLAYSQQYVQGK